MAKKKVYTQKQRDEALYMYCVKNQELSEISKALNVPIDTLNSWLSNGRWQLLKIEQNNQEYVAEAVKYIEESIRAYAMFRGLAVERGEKDGRELNPRDLKALLEIVQLADRMILDYYAISGVGNEA